MNDIDLETIGVMREANREVRLRRAGICTHSWRQGYVEAHNPHGLKPGQVKCLHCGRVATDALLDEERREALI